jgi:hypothetical protein
MIRFLVAVALLLATTTAAVVIFPNPADTPGLCMDDDGEFVESDCDEGAPLVPLSARRVYPKRVLIDEEMVAGDPCTGVG